MRITITGETGIPEKFGVSIMDYAQSSIKHWQSETEKGNPWSEGAVISFSGHGEGHQIFTSTRRTEAGWAVKVWSEERGE